MSVCGLAHLPASPPCVAGMRVLAPAWHALCAAPSLSMPCLASQKASASRIACTHCGGGAARPCAGGGAAAAAGAAGDGRAHVQLRRGAKQDAGKGARARKRRPLVTRAPAHLVMGRRQGCGGAWQVAEARRRLRERVVVGRRTPQRWPEPCRREQSGSAALRMVFVPVAHGAQRCGKDWW